MRREARREKRREERREEEKREGEGQETRGRKRVPGGECSGKLGISAGKIARVRRGLRS